MNPRWKAISPSQFPWEQEALDYIQRRMPEREPFRAYSNFEFIADDGSINEVDLLVVGRHTVYLVEIKSRPGKVGGDSHAWAWRDGAREYLDDNPLLLNHRKAKKLASLLQRQMSKQKKRAPFVQALVFLSDPAQRCTLTGPARENVHLRKECEESKHADIVMRLFDENPPVAIAQPIDRELASAIHRALEAIGISTSYSSVTAQTEFALPRRSPASTSCCRGCINGTRKSMPSWASRRVTICKDSVTTRLRATV